MRCVIGVGGLGGIESGLGLYLGNDDKQLRSGIALPQADQRFRLLDCVPLHNEVHTLGGILIDRVADAATGTSHSRHKVLERIFGRQVRRMITYDEVDHVVHLGCTASRPLFSLLRPQPQLLSGDQLAIPTQRTVLANEYPGTLYPKPDKPEANKEPITK